MAVYLAPAGAWFLQTERDPFLMRYQIIAVSVAAGVAATVGAASPALPAVGGVSARRVYGGDRRGMGR